MKKKMIKFNFPYKIIILNTCEKHEKFSGALNVLFQFWIKFNYHAAWLTMMMIIKALR